MTVARLTARIKRLEALDGARNELDDLSEAELRAQICESAERVAAEWREMLRNGTSVADILAEIERSIDEPWLAALLAEAQAPAFDAARFFADRQWLAPES